VTIYYDRQGKSLDIDTPEGMRRFGELLEDRAYRRVGLTRVRGATRSVVVSTVWLGLDHNYTGGLPLIFETMVFDGAEIGGSDVDCQRYATEEQAMRGHSEAITFWEDAIPGGLAEGMCEG
jgi:hypothetical protein